jgi:uncharacterized protein (DUF486 family)
VSWLPVLPQTTIGHKCSGRIGSRNGAARYISHRSQHHLNTANSAVHAAASFNSQESPMPFALSPAAIWPVVMLLASNVFMTFAWYGHLKHKGTAIFIAILVSWAIAFFEYCLAVPANRIGSAVYSTAQLKTMQEVITLLVFSGFSVFWLGESLTWNHAIGFALIAVGASFIFRG